MTDKEINTAIAKATGWILTAMNWWYKDGEYFAFPPDYCHDLNAMYEVEKSEDMTFNQKWIESIVEIALRENALTIERTDGWDWVAFVSRLTARQRAEAFLKTLNLWEQ